MKSGGGGLKAGLGWIVWGMFLCGFSRRGLDTVCGGFCSAVELLMSELMGKYEEIFRIISIYFLASNYSIF